MTNPVKADAPVLPNLLEGALRQLRVGLHDLSDARFPGLRTRHYRLLTCIPGAGIRVSRVVEITGLTKQALAQALELLQIGGYVDVVPDPDDGRARIVRRTARGIEVVDALLAMQASYERDWAARVGTERWLAARHVLEDLFGTLPPGFSG